MDRRKITIMLDGQPYSFYSDDPDVYLSELEKRANAVMRQAASFGQNKAALAVLLLTDQLMRTEGGPPNPEKKAARKPKADAAEKGQVSVWDLLDG